MPPKETFDSIAINARKNLKREAEFVKAIVESVKTDSFDLTPGSDKGEMIANLMLAYRHLEDASMRIGKAIQAYEGGVSIYDKDRPGRDLNEEVPKN